MFFRKCERCHKHRVAYKVGNLVQPELCKECVMLLQLRGFEFKHSKKIRTLDSFTFIGGFIIYFLCPPLIIIDWLRK